MERGESSPTDFLLATETRENIESASKPRDGSLCKYKAVLLPTAQARPYGRGGVAGTMTT